MAKADDVWGDEKATVPIDHTQVVDGFGELSSRTHYAPYKTRCGRCGASFCFTAAAQKYVYEVRQVPLKSNAKYCSRCVGVAASRNRKHRATAGLFRSVQESALAVTKTPQDPTRLLESIQARVRLAEAGETTSRQRLASDLNRLRKLAPNLDVADWRARVRQLPETDDS